MAVDPLTWNEVRDLEFSARWEERKHAERQMPLALGRGSAWPVGGGGGFSYCTSGGLRATWADDYRIRLLAPYLPAITVADLRALNLLRTEAERRASRTPAGREAEREATRELRARRRWFHDAYCDWDSRVPTITTESDTWRAGERGNDPRQVRLEIINTAFFPWERLDLLEWMDAGCPVENVAEWYATKVRWWRDWPAFDGRGMVERAAPTDLFMSTLSAEALLRELEGRYIDAILHHGDCSVEMEASLAASRLPAACRDNLIGNVRRMREARAAGEEF